MRPLTQITALVASLVAALALPLAAQAAEPAVATAAMPAPAATAPAVKDFDLFVDPPTGFVFVKLPAGWKFVGRVDAPALETLPATVHTWLLPAEGDEAVRTARPAAAAGPRS